MFICASGALREIFVPASVSAFLFPDIGVFIGWTIAPIKQGGVTAVTESLLCVVCLLLGRVSARVTTCR